MPKHVDLARHRGLHDELLRVVGETLKIYLQIREPAVDIFEALSIRPIYEDTVKMVQKVVSGGSINGPAFGKPFPFSQDLFGNDVERAPEGRLGIQRQLLIIPPQQPLFYCLPIAALVLQTGLKTISACCQKHAALHSAEILSGFVQTIRVVDPETTDLPLTNQPEYQLMGLLKHMGVFHLDSGKIIDIEESAVVDLLAGHTPEGHPVDLGGQEGIQQIKALGISFFPIEDPDILLNKSPHIHAFNGKLGESFFDDLLFALPLNDFLRVEYGCGRQMAQRCDDALKFQEVGVFSPEEFAQHTEAMFEDLSVLAGFYRQPSILIRHRERPLLKG